MTHESKIRLSVLQASAYGSREKAKGELLYDRISKPSGIEPNAQRFAHWQQCYRDLWQLKVAFEK